MLKSWFLFVDVASFKDKHVGVSGSSLSPIRNVLPLLENIAYIA